MDPDEVVLTLAVQRGLLTAPQANQARAAAATQRVPVRSLLARAIPSQALAELVAQAGASGPATPGRGVPARPSGPGHTARFDPDPGPAGDERGRLVEALQALRRQDPRFAPHAQLVFEVVAKLGEGGMGVVERVKDARLGREAALKRMRTGQEAPELVARFWREAEVTARLDHPSIPPVYEAGTDAAGRPYLLMRVIEGESLGTAIERAHAGPRPTLAALRPLLEALLKVAEAVAYAHSRGVIHRDLKPANIMVGRFGEVMVMDWGLARVGAASDAADQALRTSLPSAEDAPVGATIAGEAMGTPGYMPPEQASGEAVDARADVFALGAILVELLTGAPPIEGSSTLNRIAATVQGKIATPRARRSDLPTDLDGVAARALATDPEERTPDAATFVDELRALLAGADVPGHRYGVGERVGRLARRRPGLLVGGLGGAVAVNVVVALGLTARSAERERAAANRTRDAVQAALDLLGEAEELSHRGRREEVKERVERALAGMAAPDRPPPRSMRLAAAQAYEAAGMSQEAIDELKRSLAENPPGARELLALHRLWLVQDPRSAAFESPWVDQLEVIERTAGASVEEGLRRFVAGRRLLRAREPARARVELEAALAANPGLVPAALDLATVLVELADPKAVLATVEPVLRMPIHPRERALLLVLRAQGLGALGDVARAEADLNEALAAFPGLVTAQYGRVHFLLARSQLDEAAALIEAMPDGPLRLRVSAQLAVKRADHRGAIGWADKAIAADPNDAQAWLLRAGSRLNLLQSEAGRADLDEALRLAPRLGGALALRARLRASSDLAGAEADARAACEVLSGDPNVRLLLAAILEAKGDAEGARRARAEAEARATPEERAEKRLTDAHAAGDVAALSAEIQRTLEQFPDNVTALTLRAQVALQRNAPAAGMPDVDRAIALAPGRHLPYDVRGGLRVALGDLTGARADFDRAIELGSRNLRTLTTRATLRYNAGDLPGALADAEQALLKDSRCADAYYVRAGVRQRQGEAQGAREDLEKFLELAPSSDPRAQQLRQKLGKP